MQTIGMLLLAAATAGDGFGYDKPGVGLKKWLRPHAVARRVDISAVSDEPRRSRVDALAALLGHLFPVWLRFKGGKGVATSLGVFLAVCWKPTLITFGIWILAFVLTHIISISSLVAAVVFPVMILLFYWASADLKILLPVSLLIEKEPECRWAKGRASSF